MNLCFYEALDRIPLGMAVTFEFVGPLLVGLLGSRRALDLVWVACAAAGVLLLTGPSGSASAAGIGFALLAGAFWAAYILLSSRIGRAFPGGRGLALAMGFAAVLMAVPGTLAVGGELLDPGAAAVAALIGLIALGQGLPTSDVIGIGLVVVASAGVLGSSVAEAPTEA